MMQPTMRAVTRRVTIAITSTSTPTRTMATLATSSYRSKQSSSSSSQSSWNGYAMAGCVAAAAGAAWMLNREPVAAASVPASGLSGKDFKPFKVKQVLKYNHNTKIYVFALENPSATLDLPVSSFILTKFVGPDGKDVIRPYTPIDTHIKGELHLMVKAYPNGVMSKHFDSLKPGDSLELKGPIPKLKYEANFRSDIGMVAGGTGITPMLQILEEIFRNPQDKTKVTLLFANQTPDDILLKERLDALVKTSSGRFNVHYLVDKAPGNKFDGTIGYVNEKLLKEKLPGPDKNSLIYVCGPPGMVAAVSGPKTPDFQQGEVDGILKKLGYSKEKVFKL